MRLPDRTGAEILTQAPHPAPAAPTSPASGGVKGGKEPFFYGGQAVIEGVIVRGLALIGEQLHLGMKSLIWSANMNAGANDVEIGKKEITGSVAMAGVFALVLFIGLPLFLAGLAVPRNGGFAFVLVEGVFRVGLVLGYLAAISLLR